MTPESDGAGPEVIQWVLDTTNLWTEASKTKDLETVAAKHLSLVDATERQNVLKYVFVRDAKLSLGSALLKRHLISRHAHVPWALATASRSSGGKPIFESISFNVSHQDGLVVLAAVVGSSSAKNGLDIEVGVDVVSCKERRDRDRAAVKAEGWDAFVDVYSSVFSDGDVESLKELSKNGSGGSLSSVDGRLRCFYAYWCAKEAYVKMTGEALLAEWIQKLEFRGLKPPGPYDAAEMKFGDKVENVIGDEDRRFVVLREDGPDGEVRMEIQSLGRDYMIGTAVRRPGRPVDDVMDLRLGDYRIFELDEITGEE